MMEHIETAEKNDLDHFLIRFSMELAQLKDTEKDKNKLITRAYKLRSDYVRQAVTRGEVAYIDDLYNSFRKGL